MVYLRGYNWKDPARDAEFALRAIEFIVIIYCQVLSFLTPWLNRNGQKDAWRKVAYTLACFFFLIYDLVVLVDLIVAEVRLSVTDSYFILYIFEDVGLLTTEVLIVSILLRSVEECRKTSSRGGKAISIIHYVILTIYALISLVCLVFYIGNIAWIMGADIDFSTIPRAYYETPRAVIAILISIELLVFGIMFVIQRTMKKLPLFILLLVICLVLIYQVLLIVSVVLYDFILENQNKSVIMDYIATIVMMGIFVGLVHFARVYRKCVTGKENSQGTPFETEKPSPSELPYDYKPLQVEQIKRPEPVKFRQHSSESPYDPKAEDTAYFEDIRLSIDHRSDSGRFGGQLSELPFDSQRAEMHNYPQYFEVPNQNSRGELAATYQFYGSGEPHAR